MIEGGRYKVDLSLADRNDARIIASDFIKKDERILDVGCACGDFGVMLKKTKSCYVYGLDYDAASLELASSTGSYQYLERTDLNTYDINQHPEWEGYFDCITFLDVLEHLVSPRACLAKLLGFLRPGGDVIVSLPNLAFGDIKLGLMNNEFFYTTTGILDNTHLRFFTYKSIAGFLAESGLVVAAADFKLSVLDPKLKMVTNDELWSWICNDPHSFVYQYVMKCNRSDLPIADLTTINMAKLNVTLRDIRPRLLLLGARGMLASVLPPGSRLRRIFRDATAVFRAGR